MKQIGLFFCILWVSFLGACIPESISYDTYSEAGSITTRGSNATEILPNGSTALFNTYGSITIKNQIFTFDGNHWTGEQSIPYSDETSLTTLTALHPANNAENLITENPYSNNELIDVLIAKTTFCNEAEIDLSFNHLFSKLTFHIQSSLKESLSKISLTVPKVTQINIDGSLSISETHTTTILSNGEDNYSFIIPPKENCNLILTFTFKNDETPISHSLVHTFLGGYQYECNVTSGKEPGIYDADDLIELSKIINGLEPIHKWSNYGYINGQDTIYCLQKDITFTDDKSTLLLPIGHDTKKPFAAIFDGKGHTISGLKLQPSNGISGLFGRITPKSIIKGLHLNKCSLSSTGNIGSGIGILAGVCYGTISNCSVTESSITTSSTSPAGGLVGYARSGCNIINCSVRDTKISANGFLGGFAGDITRGNIINCYSASNTIMRRAAYSGGFCGKANNCNITNCYVYKLTLTTNENKGQFIGQGESSIISFCFTDTETNNNIRLINDNINKSCTTTSNGLYNNLDFSTKTGLYVYQRLNQWITDNQKNYNYTFTKWKSSNNLPAIFIN